MKYILILLCLVILSNCQQQSKSTQPQEEITIENEVISDKDKNKIISELQAIRDLDQKYVGIPPEEMREIHGPEKAWKIFLKQRDSIGLINQNKIKDLYAQYGYLGNKEVGEQAAADFWLIIQHADNDIKFQKEMLASLKTEIENNNANRVYYAMLEDRVNVNENKPQRFGSQLTYNDKGQAIPKIGLVDSTNVEALRKAYDMPSFKEYYNNMTLMHFEMNEESLRERGITEPQLYQ